MYRVEVDYAPTYELMVSLAAYIKSPDQKILESGPQWIRRVRQQVRPAIDEALAALDQREPFHKAPFDVLLWQSPEKRDVAGFLHWAASLSASELYERLAPYVRDEGPPLPRDLGDVRDRYVALLAVWHEHYFRHMDPAILHGLEADAAAKRALTETTPPQELVELATCGISLEPAPGREVVLLAPQYHYRPWNLLWTYRGLRAFLYPADALPPVAGEPPPALLRLTRALADESRLRLLRFLAATPRGFSEVVRHSGLAKSTVHHHLVVLRAAGLVRVHDRADGSTTYSLRGDALAALGPRLEGFLRETPAPESPQESA